MLLFDILMGNDDKVLSKIETILYSQNNLISLANGKVGVNWVFKYLTKKQQLLSKNTLADLVNDDEILKTESIELFKVGDIDFLHGALGISYYFLFDDENIDIPYHNLIIDMLFESFEKNGMFCYQNPGIYSLGLSHGLPSIIKYLIECYKRKISVEKSEKLIFSIVEFILSNKNGSEYLSCFPGVVNTMNFNETRNSRLAWCYGDLSLSYILFQTSIVFNIDSLRIYSLEIMYKCMKRKTLNESMINDAGVCHGSAGVAHIFNRMWSITNDKKFRQATDFWIKQTLEFGTKINGKTEFKKYNAKINEYEINHSLLEGNAGVGLVLYSYLTGDFSWDYCLMLND
jgi:hypothetical protein